MLMTFLIICVKIVVDLTVGNGYCPFIDVDIVKRKYRQIINRCFWKKIIMEKMRVVVSFSILLLNFITAAHSGTLFSTEADIKSEK
jgi:hypothetical protein